jgi:hypothetical protein
MFPQISAVNSRAVHTSGTAVQANPGLPSGPVLKQSPEREKFLTAVSQGKFEDILNSLYTQPVLNALACPEFRDAVLEATVNNGNGNKADTLKKLMENPSVKAGVIKGKHGLLTRILIKRDFDSAKVLLAALTSDEKKTMLANLDKHGYGVGQLPAIYGRNDIAQLLQ